MVVKGKVPHIMASMKILFLFVAVINHFLICGYVALQQEEGYILFCYHVGMLKNRNTLIWSIQIPSSSCLLRLCSVAYVHRIHILFVLLCLTFWFASFSSGQYIGRMVSVVYNFGFGDLHSLLREQWKGSTP